MPGMVLMDFTRGDHIVGEQRDELVKMVHDVLSFMTGKHPKHSSFFYQRADYLDASITDEGDQVISTNGYAYILVVDGEENEKTNELKDDIREKFKQHSATILSIDPEAIAVRYRLHNSSFG